jgi:DNA-binding NtrC family response regulator
MSTPGRLLVVDDEVDLMTSLCEMLTKQGYEAVGFSSPGDAMKALEEREFDILMTDLMMPGMDGIAMLRAGLEINPNLVGIVMTGHGTIQTAVEAMKVGAFEYVLKPFKLRDMLPVLSRAMEVRRLRMESVQLRETVTIYELGVALAFMTDPVMILDRVADTALQQVRADEASILLPTGPSSTATAASSSPPSTQPIPSGPTWKRSRRPRTGPPPSPANCSSSVAARP